MAGLTQGLQEEMAKPDTIMRGRIRETFVERKE
jgi:hypothetical protein